MGYVLIKWGREEPWIRKEVRKGRKEE